MAVTVQTIDTRRRDDGFLESEATVTAGDADQITAGNLDLSAIDYVNVSVVGRGQGAGDDGVAAASLHNPGTAANSLTVQYGSLTAGAAMTNASLVLSVTARGVQS